MKRKIIRKLKKKVHRALQKYKKNGILPITVCHILVFLFPKSIKIRLFRANLLSSCHKYNNAIEDLNFIISDIGMNNVDILSNRAFCYMESGKLELALSDIDQCLQHNPDNDFINLIKGWTVLLMCKRYDMENISNALPHLKAVRPGVYYARALNGIAYAMEIQGLLEEALYWQKLSYADRPKPKYKGRIVTLELLLKKREQEKPTEVGGDTIHPPGSTSEPSSA